MPLDMQQAVKEAAKAAEQKAIDELIDRQIRVVAGSFEKAAAYTNIIVLAGYAAFFGLWQLTKPLLSPKLALLAALLMSISAITFVVFEIYKTWASSRSILRLDQILLDPGKANNLQVLLQAFRDHADKERREHLVQIQIWYVAFLISVITGIGGAAILMFLFIQGLFR